MAKFAALSLAACTTAAVPPEVEQKFNEFENFFGKNYGSEERESRLQIFAENLEKINQLQEAEQGTAEYSYLTPFADMSESEFSSRKGFHSPSVSEAAQLLDLADAPASYDWREKGAVNDIKDQKQCGSCWAFSVVANLEGAGFVETGKLVNLSEQQLVDCSKSTGDEGCNGGLPEHTFQMMIDENRGLMWEESYPYQAKDLQCREDKSKEVLFIKNWKQIATDETQIAAALVQYGPLSIGINANTMQTYRGGVANPNKMMCNPQALDHGVAIVGYGEDASQPYWTIRNSWGQGWGEKGYYRIIRGTGACGLNQDVTSAYGITIDGSIPEPPKPTPSPDSCDAQDVHTCADCGTLCSGHGGMNCRSGSGGLVCGCGDGTGCNQGFFSLDVTV